MSETVMDTWSNIKMNSATRSPSSPRTLRRVPQSLQRLDDLGLAGHGRLALFLFFLDDLFRRIGDEFLVAELGVDALDVGVGLGDLLVEPNFFGREINHALERQRCARALVSADASANTSGVKVAGAMFISARTERMAVTRSTTQPISASAAGSLKSSASRSAITGGINGSLGPAIAIDASCSTVAPALRGHCASTSRPSRFAVTAQSSSVMNGMNGCRSLRISSRAQATIARVSVLAAPSSPSNTGFASSTYQSQ